MYDRNCVNGDGDRDSGQELCSYFMCDKKTEYMCEWDH